MKKQKNQSSATAARTDQTDKTQDIESEVFLGLRTENIELVLSPKDRRLDLHPWLLDCVAVKLTCLGHQDEIPRPWDWENILTFLEPGEELLYVLDHVTTEGSQTGRPFTLWLGIRFPSRQTLTTVDMDRRSKRARMIISQFQRQAFPGSDLEWVGPAELENILPFSSGSQQRCLCISGLPSPREIDDEKREIDRSQVTRNYQSLNDVAESIIDLYCDYRIAFVVQRVDSTTLK